VSGELVKVTLARSRSIDPSVHKVAKTLSKSGHHVKLLVWDRQNTLESNRIESIHVISPVLFIASFALLPLVLLQLPWQMDIIVLSVLAASCLLPKVRNTFLTFIQSQVYLFIGLMRATVFGRPKFLKQVESTRKTFDLDSPQK